jgi:hypothetical protein
MPSASTNPSTGMIMMWGGLKTNIPAGWPSLSSPLTQPPPADVTMEEASDGAAADEMADAGSTGAEVAELALL